MHKLLQNGNKQQEVKSGWHYSLTALLIGDSIQQPAPQPELNLKGESRAGADDDGRKGSQKVDKIHQQNPPQNNKITGVQPFRGNRDWSKSNKTSVGLQPCRFLLISLLLALQTQK